MGFQIIPGGVDPVPQGNGGAVIPDLGPQHHHIVHVLVGAAEAGPDDDTLRHAADEKTHNEHGGDAAGEQLCRFREPLPQKGHGHIE